MTACAPSHGVSAVAPGAGCHAEVVLTGNATYAVTVRAENTVGLLSTPVTSDCLTVDETPPVIDFVGVGSEYGIHQDTHSSPHAVYGTATAHDEHSVLTDFEWCLASEAGYAQNRCDLIQKPRRKETKHGDKALCLAWAGSELVASGGADGELRSTALSLPR